MATDQECVDYARECVRLAELTKDLHFGSGFSLRPASGWPPRANKKVTGQHSSSQHLFHASPRATGNCRRPSLVIRRYDELQGASAAIAHIRKVAELTRASRLN